MFHIISRKSKVGHGSLPTPGAAAVLADVAIQPGRGSGAKDKTT